MIGSDEQKLSNIRIMYRRGTFKDDAALAVGFLLRLLDAEAETTTIYKSTVIAHPSGGAAKERKKRTVVG